MPRHKARPRHLRCLCFPESFGGVALRGVALPRFFQRGARLNLSANLSLSRPFAGPAVSPPPAYLVFKQECAGCSLPSRSTAPCLRASTGLGQPKAVSTSCTALRPLEGPRDAAVWRRPRAVPRDRIGSGVRVPSE